LGCSCWGQRWRLSARLPPRPNPSSRCGSTPELGKQILRADYRYTFYPDRKVEDQEAHFGMAEHRATLFTPFYQDDRNEWGLSLKALYQNIDT